MTDTGITLRVALADFTQWGMGRYATRTVQTYTDLIGRFITWRGDVPLSDINPMDVANWHNLLKSRGYGQSSTAYAMISLRQFFRFLFLRRLIVWDYQLISVPKYVSRHYAPAFATDAKAMMSAVEPDTFKGLRDRTILSFLYSSGLRVSELCDLRASEIEPEKGYTVIISKKNRQERMVFWDTDTTFLLTTYLNERIKYAQSDHLFINVSRSIAGKKLTTRSIQRLVASLRVRKCVTPHSFRHGLGMRAVRSSIHPRNIQKILGHKNITSSQIYMDVADREVMKAYRRMTKNAQVA